MSRPLEPSESAKHVKSTEESLTKATDEQLLTAVQHGNTEAFELLDQRYRPRLTAYVHTWLATTAQNDIEDIVQQTLAYLYRKASIFTKPTVVVQSILFKQAARYMHDFERHALRARRDRRRTILFTDGGIYRQTQAHLLHARGQRDLPKLPTSSDDQYTSGHCYDPIDWRGAEKRAAAEDVREYLSQLTPAEAEIIRLMDLEGHTAQSAADTLHVTLTTTQWRYKKAHKRLQALAQKKQ